MQKDTNAIILELETLLPEIDKVNISPEGVNNNNLEKMKHDWIYLDIKQRTEYISACIIKTASGSKEQIDKAVHLFRDWMLHSSIVRVIGAGRARLAGAIPANRLAHGGARVYIQDDIIPMPHSIKGGGIIAVSASGKTSSVLEVLKSVRKKGGDIKIVGIAKKGQEPFRSYCDIFIGIDQEDIGLPNPLQALADVGEQVISELLDAIVVAAGKLAGFDDTKWRIGHEDIGATGPYDLIAKTDLHISNIS